MSSMNDNQGGLHGEAARASYYDEENEDDADDDSTLDSDESEVDTDDEDLDDDYSSDSDPNLDSPDRFALSHFLQAEWARTEESQKRHAIEHLYLVIGSPPTEEWNGPDGTFANIRRRMYLTPADVSDSYLHAILAAFCERNAN
ncbi:hypothetical protein MPSEU_000930200 [Mayamaea pseudoterrestris]|nr:hypothetical protein MPSEU_000930200 [Mayamaea pseudoterrestris]